MTGKCIESIPPHVGDYFLYEGHYIIPQGFSFTVEDNSITIVQNHEFKIGEMVHTINEDFANNRRIIVGKVSEVLKDGCLVFEGYIHGCEWHPERIPAHPAFSKPAEDWEIKMYEESKEEYENS